MRRAIELVRHPFTASMIRYGIAGGVVTVVYLGLPVAANEVLRIPIQICIPIAYVIAVSLQFTLQRVYVFRHVDRFALPVRRQIAWYVAIGAVQYPLSAIAVAILPRLLDVPQRWVFVMSAAMISLVSFLFLRRRVFHGADEPTASTPNHLPT